MQRRRPRAANAVDLAASAVIETLEARALFASTTFTVDPALSSLRLSGEVGSVLDLDEQHSGSLVDTYDGTIVADITADTISFPGDSSVNAQATRHYSPGDGFANYGGKSETGGLFSVKIGEAAVRNLKFDVRSDVLPLSDGGAFGASAIDLKTTGGKLEYDLRVGNDGDIDLGAKTLDNNGAGNATLRGSGGNLTLTIPVDISLSEDSADLHLRGTLVANAGTGAPPDPNSVRLGDGSLIKSLQFTDADGTVATIGVRGGGSVDVHFQNGTSQTAGKAGSVVIAGDGLTLTGVDAVGTTRRTAIAFSGKGGTNSATSIPSFTADGAVASVGGKGVTFTGPVTAGGRIGALTAAGLAGASVHADSIGAVKVTGDVTTSEILVTDPFASGTFALGKLTVGGAFSQSSVSAAGAIGPVKATTIIRSQITSAVSNGADVFPQAADLSAEGLIGNVTAKNFADSVIAADTLGKLKFATLVTDNDGTPFGIAADAFAGLQATNSSKQKLKLTLQDDPALLTTALAAQTFDTGDFEIRLA